MKLTPKLERMLENAVAISDTFNSDHDRYMDFYHAHGSNLSGFPGIWMFLARASFIFSEAEATVKWDGEYIAATQNFACELLKMAHNTKLPDDRGLRMVAKGAIMEALKA
jgi:hypothetical protein